MRLALSISKSFHPQNNCSIQAMQVIASAAAGKPMHSQSSKHEDINSKNYTIYTWSRAMYLIGQKVCMGYILPMTQFVKVLNYSSVFLLSFSTTSSLGSSQ